MCFRINFLSFISNCRKVHWLAPKHCINYLIYYCFSWQVLGTDAGGTMEIVEDKVTGLLHPIGREGIPVLAENMLYLVSNPSAREKMGARGRQLVQDKYLKHHMYEKFAQVLVKCVKIN